MLCGLGGFCGLLLLIILIFITTKPYRYLAYDDNSAWNPVLGAYSQSPFNISQRSAVPTEESNRMVLVQGILSVYRHKIIFKNGRFEFNQIYRVEESKLPPFWIELPIKKPTMLETMNEILHRRTIKL